MDVDFMKEVGDCCLIVISEGELVFTLLEGFDKDHFRFRFRDFGLLDS